MDYSTLKHLTNQQVSKIKELVRHHSPLLYNEELTISEIKKLIKYKREVFKKQNPGKRFYVSKECPELTISPFEYFLNKKYNGIILDIDSKMGRFVDNELLGRQMIISNIKAEIKSLNEEIQKRKNKANQSYGQESFKDEGRILSMHLFFKNIKIDFFTEHLRWMQKPPENAYKEWKDGNYRPKTVNEMLRHVSTEDIEKIKTESKEILFKYGEIQLNYFKEEFYKLINDKPETLTKRIIQEEIKLVEEAIFYPIEKIKWNQYFKLTYNCGSSGGGFEILKRWINEFLYRGFECYVTPNPNIKLDGSKRLDEPFVAFALIKYLKFLENYQPEIKNSSFSIATNLSEQIIKNKDDKKFTAKQVAMYFQIAGIRFSSERDTREKIKMFGLNSTDHFYNKHYNKLRNMAQRVAVNGDSKKAYKAVIADYNKVIELCLIENDEAAAKKANKEKKEVEKRKSQMFKADSD